MSFLSFRSVFRSPLTILSRSRDSETNPAYSSNRNEADELSRSARRLYRPPVSQGRSSANEASLMNRDLGNTSDAGGVLTGLAPFARLASETPSKKRSLETMLRDNSDSGPGYPDKLTTELEKMVRTSSYVPVSTARSDDSRVLESHDRVVSPSDSQSEAPRSLRGMGTRDSGASAEASDQENNGSDMIAPTTETEGNNGAVNSPSVGSNPVS